MDGISKSLWLNGKIMKSFSSKTSFKSMIYLSKIITYENSGILVLHFFANLKKGQIKINTYVKSKEEKHIHTPLKQKDWILSECAL